MSTNSSPGCIVLLIDESAGMSVVMRDLVADGKASNKSNAERIATSINALLKQLGDGGDVELAIVGYRTDAQGQVDVGCRWSGPLAGREFVALRELAASPVRRETRTRRLPATDGSILEEQVEFPIWYEPTLGVKAPQIAAFNFCRELIERWLSGAGPQPETPLVLHVFSGSSGDGNPQMAVDKLLETTTPSGAPVVVQFHVAASSALVSSPYPSNPAYLALGPPRDLFRRASLLPEKLAAALRSAKVVVSKGARGMIFNGKISDLIHCLGLVKAQVKDWSAKTAPAAANPVASPPVAAASPVTATGHSIATVSSNGGAVDELPVAGDSSAVSAVERRGLIVFVLDRSVSDPFSGNVDNPCTRLQDAANDLLKQISKFSSGELDTAIVSYGLDGSGQCEVRDTFEGPLGGKTIVRHDELADGAIRVEEFEEQVSNGIGGLITMTRKKQIYFDVEPTSSAPPHDAYATVSRIVSQWCGEHPTALAPMVLHLTRGQVDSAEMQQAVTLLRSSQTTAGPVLLYHLVLTESPHKSLAYPDTDADIQETSLRALWDLSSTLAGWQNLSATRPSLKAESHGFVINGKFDVLVEGAKNSLAGAEAAALAAV